MGGEAQRLEPAGPCRPAGNPHLHALPAAAPLIATLAGFQAMDQEVNCTEAPSLHLVPAGTHVGFAGGWCVW